MKLNNKKYLKGSATVVVIFASITASIYMISAFADYEHYNILLSKNEKLLKQRYETKVENVDKYYSDFESKITEEESFILE